MNWASVPWGLILAYAGVAFSSLAAGIGSARGVGIAGNAANGVMSENPDLFGSLIVLVALPGTQGIYGLLIGFLILLRVGGLGVPEAVTIAQGFILLLGAIPMGIVGYASAVYQGQVAATGIGLVAKRAEASGKAITMAVMVETYAVLALLISFLVVMFVPIG
ncbi:MAG: V-type ATP synthase subunit K [Symbiobacteriaceae bacterium]|nr:V-type ATP synthase subunit K [Symbiobacteriaceae bacterium]